MVRSIGEHIKAVLPRPEDLRLFRSVIFYGATFCLWPILISFYSIFAIYRTIVDIILRIRQGDRYGGLLCASDAVFEAEHATRHILGVTFILKSEKKIDMLEIVKKRVQQKVFNRPYGDYVKLTSTRHWSMGYPYWMKYNYNTEDCVTSIPLPESNVPYNEEYVKDYVKSTLVSPFPKNDTAMWQLMVGAVPLESNENDTSYRYPLIMRYHHGVADGTSVLSFILNTFCNDYTESYSDGIFTSRFNLERKKYSVSEILKNICFYLYVFAIFPGQLLKINFLRRKENNALYDQVLCGKKNFASTDYNVNYIPVIKEIKNRVPNTTFSNVVNTAVVASFTNFFKRNSYDVPDMMTHLIASLLTFTKMDLSKIAPMENKATAYFLNLPTCKSSTLLELLENIKTHTEISYEGLLVFRIGNLQLPGLLPFNVLKHVSLVKNCTNFITNIPGCKQTRLLDDILIEKIIPFPPNVLGIGISLSVVSYDNKLLFSLVVDQALMPSNDEAQRFVDDILCNIKQLDYESRQIYK